jgi:hypothetical protein
VLNSSSGGMVMYDNLASWDSCERLRLRASAATNRQDGYSYVSGACTQVEKFVPAPASGPVVNVSPAEIKVPAPQVRVIIKDKK